MNQIINQTLKVTNFEDAAMPHLKELYRAARYLVGNSTDAEDVVQEAYLQAWKSFHRFELGTNCRAWLFKILFHVIHHYRRKAMKFDWRKESDDSLAETLVYEPPVAQHLSDEEVLAAFERIPLAYRDVVMLADVQEFSYQEIAETLTIPLGTVMSRLSRGRKALRRELSGVAESYGLMHLHRAQVGVPA